MNICGQAVLLRVFVGESDKLGHLPLYEAIVQHARDADLAGATVLKGVMGFGASARIRTQKILDLSSDLSLVIEIVDEESKIAAFQLVLTEMLAGRVWWSRYPGKYPHSSLFTTKINGLSEYSHSRYLSFISSVVRWVGMSPTSFSLYKCKKNPVFTPGFPF